MLMKKVDELLGDDDTSLSKLIGHLHFSFVLSFSCSTYNTISLFKIHEIFFANGIIFTVGFHVIYFNTKKI